MRPGPGQLQRAITGLAIGPIRARDRRNRSLADTRTGEWEQQLHVPIAGIAGTTWTFSDRDVAWELPFVAAPLQRVSELEQPHFSSGFVMRSTGPDLIRLDAHVLGWSITEEDWYVGARVRFAALAPLVAEPVSFSAVAHLRFQGFASQAESDEE